MNIPIGANVICTDGRLGKSRYVPIDPISQEVTHVVKRLHKARELATVS